MHHLVAVADLDVIDGRALERCDSGRGWQVEDIAIAEGLVNTRFDRFMSLLCGNDVGGIELGAPLEALLNTRAQSGFRTCNPFAVVGPNRCRLDHAKGLEPLGQPGGRDLYLLLLADHLGQAFDSWRQRDAEPPVYQSESSVADKSGSSFVRMPIALILTNSGGCALCGRATPFASGSFRDQRSASKLLHGHRGSNLRSRNRRWFGYWAYNDAILQSTSNGIFTLDLEDRVLTANVAVFQILERPSAEIISQPANELFSGSNLWLFNSLQKVGRTGEQEITVEAELETGSAATVSVNASVSPLIDAMDESIGSMVGLEDITTEKRVKSTMARYMSAEVADQLLESGEAELGGKDQLVSILFSDIRGFTTISEALGARDTVSMLNDYFEAMVDSIMERQGVLDKFIGDAIMALFGVPFNGEQDSDDAVLAAIGMQIALRAHNEQR